MKARIPALFFLSAGLLSAQEFPAEQVRQLTSQGQTLAVEQIFRAQMKAHPENLDLVQGLIGLYMRQQQFVKAAAAQSELIAALDKNDPRLRSTVTAAASLLENMNDFTAAEALYRRADSLPQPPPSGPHIRPSDLGEFYARHRRWSQAEQVYRDLSRRDDLSFLMRVAVLNNLASVLSAQHREAEALTLEREVAKLCDSSDDPLAPRAAAQAREALARLATASDPDAAHRFYEAEMQRTSGLTGPARAQYAQAMMSYLILLERQKDFDGAEKLLHQYLAEAQGQTDPAGPFKLTTAYAFLANLEYQRGDMEAGHRWRAQDPNYRPPEAIPPADLEAVNTAQRLFAEGNTQDAILQLDQALAALPNAGREATYRLGQVTSLLMSLRQSGQTEAAESALQRAIASLERLYGADSQQAMQLEIDYCQQFCPDRGLKLIERARLTDAQRHGLDHPSQVEWIEREILFLKQANRPDDIESEYTELIRLASAIFGPRHSRTIAEMRAYASDINLLKAHARRLDQLWTPLLDLSAELYGPESPDHTGTLTGYAFSLARVEQYDRAIDLLTRHLRLLAAFPNAGQAQQQTEAALDSIRRMASRKKAS